MTESQSDIEARLETLRAELDAVISEIARIPTVVPIEQSHSNIQHSLNLNSKKERLENEIAELKAKIPNHGFWKRNSDTIIVGILMLIIGSAITYFLTPSSKPSSSQQTTPQSPETPKLE